MELPLVGDVFRAVRQQYPDIGTSLTIHEAIRRLIGLMVNDVLEETRARLAASGVDSPEAVRALDHPVVSFSESMLVQLSAVRRFLYANMYLQYKVKRAKEKGKRIVGELFEAFLDDPALLPTEFHRQADTPGSPETARVVCDYIAGMTDRYAIDQHRQLFHVEAWR
jgi:dGTPase